MKTFLRPSTTQHPRLLTLFYQLQAIKPHYAPRKTGLLRLRVTKPMTYNDRGLRSGTKREVWTHNRWVATAVHDEAPVEFRSPYIVNPALQTESWLQEKLIPLWRKRFQPSWRLRSSSELNVALRKSSQKAQRSIQPPVIYTVFEQVTVDLLNQDVNGKPLNAHTVKIFDIYAAGKRLSKTLLALSSCNARIETFLRCKRNKTMGNK